MNKLKKKHEKEKPKKIMNNVMQETDEGRSKYQRTYVSWVNQNTNSCLTFREYCVNGICSQRICRYC